MIPAGRVAASLLLAICACSCGGPRERGAGGTGAGGEAGADAGLGAPNSLMPAAETREVLLLFASPEDDRLRAERRDLPWNPSVEERAKGAVLALIAGPEGELLPVLPPESALRELFVMKDGTAVVDFGASIEARAVGSSAEFTAIYAVVDTLALNFPEIRRVGFLVEGEERETLFGHLDARYPFAPSTAPLQAALAVRLRAILAERGEEPVEGTDTAPPPGPLPVPIGPTLPGPAGSQGAPVAPLAL